MNSKRSNLWFVFRSVFRLSKDDIAFILCHLYKKITHVETEVAKPKREKYETEIASIPSDYETYIPQKEGWFTA